MCIICDSLLILSQTVICAASVEESIHIGGVKFQDCGEVSDCLQSHLCLIMNVLLCIKQQSRYWHVVKLEVNRLTSSNWPSLSKEMPLHNAQI